MHAVLDEWRIWMESQALSPRTIHERLATMRNLAGHADLDDLTQITPRAIVRYCGRSGLAPASKATYHATIRAFCQWLIKADYRDDDPTLKTPTPKRGKSRPRPISDDQLDALLAHANRRRTRTYILLATLAGLRVHEIAKLRGDDIAGARLTVTGKGNSTWVVPLHPRLVEEATHHPSSGYWFPTYDPQSTAPHVGAHAVSKAIRDTMRRAGFDGKPHQLRHWFGTSLVTSGVDLGVVQKLMRHESPQTTTIYADVHFGLQTDGIAKLHLPRAA